MAPAATTADPRAQRRRGRLLPAALVLLAIVVVIVVVVIATAPAPTKVVLRNVVYPTSSRPPPRSNSSSPKTPSSRSSARRARPGDSRASAPCALASDPCRADQCRPPRRSRRLSAAVPARDGRVQRRAGPRRDGADHRRRARQPRQAQHRDRDRARRCRRDRRRQHRLPDRAQGRPLAARAPRALSPPAPRGAEHRRAVLRAPRPQGRVLRALPARPARLGLLARRRDAHALALVRPSGTPSVGSPGPRRSACSPTSSATPPATQSRHSESTDSSRSYSRSAAPSSPIAATTAAKSPLRRMPKWSQPHSIPTSPKEMCNTGGSPGRRVAQQPFPQGAIRSQRSAITLSSPSEKREKKCSLTTARCVSRASINRSRPSSVRQA